jgi:phosphatidylglycerophosphatase A
LKGVARALATGLGAGYLPLAPGTWGSLVAVAMASAIHYFLPGREAVLLWLGFLFFTIVGIIVSGWVAQEENLTDPSIVVVDEMAGQFLTFLWIPLSPAALLFGFLLFRIFDITKPFPARRSERLPGGYGIVCDDLVAGVYAGVSLYLVFAYTPLAP